MLNPSPPIFLLLMASVLTVWVCYSDSLRPHRNFRDALKAAGWLLLFFCLALLANVPYWLAAELRKLP